MKILLVEDDEQLCETLSFELECDNFTVECVHDGRNGLEKILRQEHDLILLDQMLPFVNGIDILRQVRQQGIHTPVIFLTALGSRENKIDGLDAGADDYVVKPFDTGELVARINSITRRINTVEDTEVLHFADISYRPLENTLFFDKRPFILTKKEGELLEVFLKNPGTVLNRQLILSRVWGPYAEIEDGNLDNYIYLLRKRLKEIQCQISISTIKGIGYCLVDNRS